eukprot:s277_g1.t3
MSYKACCVSTAQGIISQWLLQWSRDVSTPSEACRVDRGGPRSQEAHVRGGDGHARQSLWSRCLFEATEPGGCQHRLGLSQKRFGPVRRPPTSSSISGFDSSTGASALHPWLAHRGICSSQAGFERKGIFKMPSDASVAAVAIFNDRYDVGYLCAAINAAYCEQHNYRFAPVVLSESEMEAICEGRHFAWAKVALLRWLYSHVGARGMQNSILEAKIGSEERDALLAADWLVWFDADLMVVNHSRPLESFLYDQKDLILGEDMADLDWLNTGLMFCKVRSAWMKSLWAKVWNEGDAKFHLGEFWDQSALCGCLAKWGEFCPDVLGGKQIATAKETPWFSWQGGPRVRETEHLRVLDAGGTQTNNPRYARFAFHAAGMKDKSRCCRHIVEVGMVRDRQQSEKAQLRCRSFSEGSQSAPGAWPAAFDVIGNAPASTGAPFGWPVIPLQRKSLRTLAAGGQATPVHLLAELPPSRLSLTAMSDTPLGDRQVEMIDRAPRRADDLPPAGRPFGRQLRVRLWEGARYAAGTPPSAHAVLREMSPARAWQVNWRPWAAAGGASEVPRPELPAAFDADDHNIEEALLSVAPPGAEVRLHQLEEGRDWLIWQLDGTQQVILFPPDCEKAKMRGGKLLEPGQSAYVPWADDEAEPYSVVLLKGEALRVPGGWYLAQRSLAPCVGLLCPLGPAQENAAPPDLGPFRPEELQTAAAKLLEREHEGGGAPVSPGGLPALKHTLQAGGTETPQVPRYNAVCHVGLYLGRPPKLMRTSRGASPQVFCLGADASLKPIEEVLRSMHKGERALIAFPSEAKVLDVEILAVLCPESPDDPRQDFSNLYSRAWWSWFEDPLQWQPLPSRPLPTGAPCAHCGQPPGVLRCAGCHQVAYCSKACQREDWPYHRSSCSATAKKGERALVDGGNWHPRHPKHPRSCSIGSAPIPLLGRSEEPKNPKMATKVFETNIAPWSNHEWPEVFATSKSMSPQAFLAFRFISAATFLGHAVAHILWRLEEGDGWYYWAYLTHIAVWVEVVSEILLVILAIQGYRSLSAPRLSTLPTLVRVEMAIYAIVLPTSLLVVVLYWTLVRPIWDVVSGVEDVPSYLSIFVHLLNFILLIIGLFLSRLPYSINRVGWSLLFGFGYVAWTIIHFLAQIGSPRECDQYPTREECPLYDAWDWNNPTIPTIISVSLLFVLPLVGLIYVGFVGCRNGCDPLLKNKSTSVPVGENLEEGKTNVESVEKSQK